ncbi:MAG: metallophosphoesterase [Opitutales bacterium]|nr:metallophosphoesterase [Opitutales bacterium]NRA25824.1 metallophosphoesterase [Opitutales bacterium]
MIPSHKGYRLAWQGVDWILDPGRALFREDTKELLIADWHLGKALKLQESGVAMPEQATVDEFVRVTQLAERYNAHRLVVLGDWIHARLEDGAVLKDRLRRFVKDLRCPVLLLMGNHDRAWSALWRDVGVQTEVSLISSSICYMHGDRKMDTDLPSVMGHFHPGRRVKLGPRQSVLVRGFWLRSRAMILPAFGELTRMSHVEEPQDRFFAILENQYVREV